MKILGATVRMLREWVRFAVITLLLFLTIRVFALEAFSIPTSSMENTLLVGDFLLVNKLLYGAEIPGTRLHLPAVREPARGDVVVFRPAHDPGRNYVKRVVGIPGDTLEMIDKVLYLNGEAREEEFVRHIDRRGDAIHPAMAWQSDHLVAARPGPGYVPSRDTWGPLVVPSGEYFVLGDNRDNSEDSRYWGFVDRNAVMGHPWVVYVSFRTGDGGKGIMERVRWDRIGYRIR
jgi:signal peptidase I